MGIIEAGEKLLEGIGAGEKVYRVVKTLLTRRTIISPSNNLKVGRGWNWDFEPSYSITEDGPFEVPVDVRAFLPVRVERSTLNTPGEVSLVSPIEFKDLLLVVGEREASKLVGLDKDSCINRIDIKKEKGLEIKELSLDCNAIVDSLPSSIPKDSAKCLITAEIPRITKEEVPFGKEVLNESDDSQVENDKKKVGYEFYEDFDKLFEGEATLKEVKAEVDSFTYPFDVDSLQSQLSPENKAPPKLSQIDFIASGKGEITKILKVQVEEKVKDKGSWKYEEKSWILPVIEEMKEKEIANLNIYAAVG